MENGYAICLNKWALDKDIKNELGLLLIISSLCAEKGFCFASNKYFMELFNIPEENISRKIKKLEEKGYITIEYEKVGCQIKKRYIRLTKISTVDCQKYQSTIDENVKDNIISINITSNNKKEIYKEKKKSYGEYKRVKLTDEEYNRLVQEYGKEFIDIQIEKLDQYVESNNNKNKYTNFNLVLRKSIKEKWFINKSYKKQAVEPEWLGKEIVKEEMRDDTKRILQYINGEN
jgi:DNA-binding Lrp family transcriptional regulator